MSKVIAPGSSFLLSARNSPREKARRLAKQLGCTLEYRRSRCAKHVDIDLPEGTKMAGTLDVDGLHHECELDEDIWPGVVQELAALELEPMHVAAA
jgi:hypothetical protein